MVMKTYTPLDEADEAVVTEAIGCGYRSPPRRWGQGSRSQSTTVRFSLELDSSGNSFRE